MNYDNDILLLETMIRVRCFEEAVIEKKEAGLILVRSILLSGKRLLM